MTISNDGCFAGNAMLCATVVDCCMQVQGFTGINRRMQLLGGCTSDQFLKHCHPRLPVSDGMHGLGRGGHVHVYDDYAHHPTEISATLAAVHKKHADSLVIAVWQPISRGRLSAFMHDFCAALESVHRVIIVPMDTSREAVDPNADDMLAQQACSMLNEPEITGQRLYKRACIAHAHEEAIVALQNAVLAVAAKRACIDTVVLFMGSGNITSMAHKFSTML